MKEREIASETVCKTRTEYSGKSDCLIYQETWRFMENWEQTVIILDEKWPKHFEGAENQPKMRPDLDSACLRTHLITFGDF